LPVARRRCTSANWCRCIWGMGSDTRGELAQPAVSSACSMSRAVLELWRASYIVAKRVGPTGAVVAVDLNPGMLSVAQAVVLTDSRSSPPIQWQEANADKLPFPDGSFDVVYCQLGLQFIADPQHARPTRRGALRGPHGLARRERRRCKPSPAAPAPVPNPSWRERSARGRVSANLSFERPVGSMIAVAARFLLARRNDELTPRGRV
jgi:hypothetical protein